MPEQRLVLEERLRANELKALVATSALGMGFDKGDLAFCVHLGLPPTPVAYYQQIGRAGRALDRADVVALPRPVEDAAVWRWFEQVSLPPAATCAEVLRQLSLGRPTSVPSLEAVVNLGRTRLQTLLKILEVDGAIRAVKGGYVLADPGWEYDHGKAERLRTLRREEAEQMLAFADRPGCRLRFLREALDDPTVGVDGPVDCGRCDRCLGVAPDLRLDPELVAEAGRPLAARLDADVARAQVAPGLDEPKGRIGPDRQARWGRALCRVGDGGWGPVIDEVLAGDRLLHEDMVRAVAGVLKRWDWDARPTWICPVPSRHRQGLVDRLCSGLSQLGKLPVHPVLVRAGEAGFQADQANSAHQVANVWGRLVVDPAALPEGSVLDGPVLLVDDECDSRCTITVAAHTLQEAGTGPVLPLVLRTR
jgi:ATP-dependent DNA helicase RecQ